MTEGEDLRNQNRQLLLALQESRQQREDLRRLNAELEETNQGVVAMYSELSKELEETNSGVVALYAELEEKTRQLKLASEAKTRFWANVSHELRSPVNSVISLAQLLRSDPEHELSEDQHQQVSLIAASGNTLLALVEELLDVAKAESGRLEPQLVEIDMRTLLHQLRGTLQGTAHPGVRLDIPDIPGPGRFVTDEVMLTRILRNVLSNGLKFTRQGSVAMTAAQDPSADALVVTVTDTGVGVPEDQQERIFEEFYQVRGPHQRGRSGTGLGLPYARKLAELLGGRLTLASTEGEGTTVTITIPSGRQPDTAVTGTLTPGSPPLRSLVAVDDDEAFLTALRPALAALAERPVTVTSSAQAIDAVLDVQPQALLLDLTMPPPDGYALLAQLARDPRTRSVPVVVLTANDAALVDHSRLGHARTVLSKTHLTAERLAGALGLLPPPERTQDRT
jgi:signal transduction histidine kinase/CheY-like chemotaxis protein